MRTRGDAARQEALLEHRRQPLGVHTLIERGLQPKATVTEGAPKSEHIDPLRLLNEVEMVVRSLQQ